MDQQQVEADAGRQTAQAPVPASAIARAPRLRPTRQRDQPAAGQRPRIQRRREFVDAARNLGVGNISIIFREILPNALPPVIVFASVVMATSILMESALAFLALGDPNFASWGNMIGQGRAVLRTDWYCTVIPGVAILLTVLSFSLLGEGLNDVLKPRQKT